MDIYFNNTELALLYFILTICIAVTLSFIIFKYMIYRERRLTYEFFKLRDALIHCVATNSIKLDDQLFRLFYSSTNDLINATQTDFFSLLNFYDIVKNMNEKEAREFGQKLIDEIKLRPIEFQKVINDILYAITKTFFEKNIIFKFIMNTSLILIFVKRYYNLIKGIIPVPMYKEYYDECTKIDKLRNEIKTNLVYA